MEIVLCIFLGIWISLAGVVAYFWIKREESSYIEDDSKEARR